MEQKSFRIFFGEQARAVNVNVEYFHEGGVSRGYWGPGYAASAEINKAFVWRGKDRVPVIMHPDIKEKWETILAER